MNACPAPPPASPPHQIIYLYILHRYKNFQYLILMLDCESGYELLYIKFDIMELYV